MNRSNKGFGLTGVFFAVVVLIVSAVLSTTATSAEFASQEQAHQHKTPHCEKSHQNKVDRLKS